MARVLVIEDNEFNRELMRYTLGAWGHDVLLAPDAETGIELARGERPDLIVCDIKLPGADGYAVARTLKADPLLRTTPLVAVTAFAMVGDDRAALEAGFDAHHAKPIDPARFMDALGPFLATPSAAPVPAAGGGGKAQGHIDAELCAPWQPCVLLTVDDGPINREYKRDLFEPAGYTVRAAARPAEALEQLRRQPVDLLISDVAMPDGGGFELLRRLRAEPAWRDLPFIFLTSTARDPRSIEQGLALGADAYLIRPVDAVMLLFEIRRALRRRT